MSQDFPCGPVVDSALPLQGAWVPSLVGELRFHMPCGASKKEKRNVLSQCTSEIMLWCGSNRPTCVGKLFLGRGKRSLGGISPGGRSSRPTPEQCYFRPPKDWPPRAVALEAAVRQSGIRASEEAWSCLSDGDSDSLDGKHLSSNQVDWAIKTFIFHTPSNTHLNTPFWCSPPRKECPTLT